MEISKQIQLYIAFNQRWVLLHIVLLNLSIFFLASRYFPIPILSIETVNGLIVWAIGFMGFFINLFGIIGRCEKICYLKILKRKIDTGCKKERDFAKKVFNAVIKKGVLKMYPFRFPKSDKSGTG